MEHKNAGRHSGKIYRLFELLGHTEGQLYIAEIAVLITLLIGTAVYILLLRVLPDTSWLEGCQIRRFTGVICPACGTTRAVLAMLHGHLLVLPCGDCVSGVHLYHLSGRQYDQACHEWQGTACEIPAVVCVCVAWDICGVLRGEAGGAGVCHIMSAS